MTTDELLRHLDTEHKVVALIDDFKVLTAFHAREHRMRPEMGHGHGSEEDA